MKRMIFAILCLSTMLFSQNLCRTDILKTEPDVSSKELKDRLLKYDFSDIFTTTPNKFVYGVIGEEMQRFKIKIITVMKSKGKQNKYSVFGKTLRDGKVREFSGDIAITSIKEIIYTKEERNLMQNEGYFDMSRVKTTGILSGNYVFKEYEQDKESGIFFGSLQSKWFLDENNKIKYNDLKGYSDGYFNNSFVGFFEKYASQNKVIANWADFRVPNTPCDFDIGAGDFSPSDKYLKNGWEDYQKALNENSAAQEIENKEWWK
ncbi:MAG: hypothetical protein ACK5LP_04925 [Campylobacteraceae bacterium]